LSSPTRKPGQKDLERLASQLTKLAEVPPDADDSGYFYNAVYEMVEDIWKQDWRAEEWQPSEALRTAQSAAQKLNEALGSLENDDQRRLMRLLDHKPLFSPHENQWVELTLMVNSLAALFALSVGTSGPSSMPGTDRLPVGAGRRRGTSNNPAFQRLIEYLRMLASWAGGEFRLDKNYPERSNLIEALDLLRPHLPDGLIPETDEKTSYSTVQNLVTRQNKIWKRSEKPLSIRDFDLAPSGLPRNRE
jgi:hypothetical protein